MNFLSKFNVLLSVVSLILIGTQTFYHLSTGTYFIFNIIDSLICIPFLIQWCVKFYQAKSWKFLKFGWIDLLLAIPFTNSFWIANYGILRILRCIRSLKCIYEYFDRDHKTSRFVDCCIISISFIIIAAIAVFNFEKHEPTANIKNLSDSLWWAMATITTIGYGDRFPVTDSGRIMASLVMIGGVGLYASFTGFIVSKFINDHRIDWLVKENNEIKQMLQQIIDNRVDK